MNYNNYQNYGYNTYPYNNPYQGQQMNNGYNQQQLNNNLNNYNNFPNQYAQNQPQTQMRVKCDFIAVSNLEEVKSYIMQPNTTVLFKDVNNKTLYEKKTDSQGISEIKAYRETTISQNNNNNDYITINQFNDFRNEIEQKINDCVQKTQNMNSIGGKDNE